MAEFIELLSKNALSDLEKANAELLKMVSTVDKVGEKMAKITTPSGADGSLKELTAQYKEQEKTIISLQKQLTALANQRAKNAQKTSEEIVNGRQLAQNADNEAKSKSKLVGEYKRVEAEVYKLTQAYNNLAIKQELGLTLNSKESASLVVMQKELLKYNDALKRVDAGVGKHTRDVGNYAKANSNLSFSIAQISRELPNFGQSFQIGILSLTNNIGFLQDGIRQVTEQNKILKAEGKETTSVFSQITKALFSWNTLLYIGIGLFSAYSKEISVWVKNLISGGEALSDLNESQSTLNASTLEGRKNAIKDKTELKALLEVAKEKKLSDLERAAAIDKIRSSYGFYFKDITDGQLLEGEFGDALKRTSQALEARERSNLIKTITDENKAKILGLEIERSLISTTEARVNPKKYKEREEIQKKINALLAQNLVWEAESVRLKKISQGLDVTIKKEKDDKKDKKEKIQLNYDEVKSEYDLRLAILERQKAEINDRINNENLSLDQRLKARKQFSEKSIEILDLQLQREKALILEKGGEDIAKNNLAFKNREISYSQFAENIKDIDNRLKNEIATSDLEYSLKWNDLLNSDVAFYKKIEEEKRGFTEKTNSLLLKSEIDKFKKVSENEENTLKTKQKAFEEYVKMSEKELEIARIKELANARSAEEIDFINNKYSEQIRLLSELESPLMKAEKAAKAYAKTFSDSFTNNAGLTTFFDVLNDGLDKFGDNWQAKTLMITEAFQEMVNFIADVTQKNYEAEYSQLEKQKNIAILFAGESETAKAEIERQAEVRRKEIQKREFKAKKQLATFNVIIDTAQAIVAFLAQGNIGASIFAGIVGAAQLAVIQSQKVPEFWQGGVHEGGLLKMNDDPKGVKGSNYREVAVTPSGKVFKPQGRDVIANMPKGTQIFPTLKSFDEFDFNNQLSNILASSSISNAPMVINNSSGAISDGQVNKIVSAIENKTETTWAVSNGELKQLSRKGNVEIESHNNRINAIGKSV